MTEWNYIGFHNWAPMHGVLPQDMYLKALRASLGARIPREMCDGCVCWREFGTCVMVQVGIWCQESVYHNCCPILFFDIIGHTLPVLSAEEESEVS